MSKEIIRANILIAMKPHVDGITLSMLEDVLTKELGKIDIVDNKNELSTIDDTNKYIVDLYKMRRESKLSPRTMSYYMDSLTRFIDFIQKPLTLASEMDVDCFLRHLRSLNNNEVSVNNHRRNLSSIYNWLRKQRIVIYNPCEAVDAYKEISKPIEHLTAEEHERLTEGCKHKRDRALIEFLRCTGIRGGEISEIRVRDIKWDENKIVIYGGKSRKYRVVCFDDIAKRYMRQYIDYRKIPLDSKEPLFVHLYKNTPLNTSGVWSSIKTIARRSNIDKNVYTHLFRKSVATRIVKRGGSIHDAGEYLGHKDNSTAGKHYAYIDENHTINIFKKYVAVV